MPEEHVEENVAEDAKRGPRHQSATEALLCSGRLLVPRSFVPRRIVAVFPSALGARPAAVVVVGAAVVLILAGTFERVDKLAGALENIGILGVVVALTAHLVVVAVVFYVFCFGRYGWRCARNRERNRVSMNLAEKR